MVELPRASSSPRGDGNYDHCSSHEADSCEDGESSNGRSRGVPCARSPSSGLFVQPQFYWSLQLLTGRLGTCRCRSNDDCSLPILNLFHFLGQTHNSLTRTLIALPN